MINSFATFFLLKFKNDLQLEYCDFYFHVSAMQSSQSETQRRRNVSHLLEIIKVLVFEFLFKIFQKNEFLHFRLS